MMDVGDALSKTLARLTTIRRINLSFTRLTPTFEQTVLALVDLERIALDGTLVTRAALEPLMTLGRLTELSLLYCANLMTSDYLLLRQSTSLWRPCICTDAEIVRHNLSWRR